MKIRQNYTAAHRETLSAKIAKHAALFCLFGAIGCMMALGFH